MLGDSLAHSLCSSSSKRWWMELGGQSFHTKLGKTNSQPLRSQAHAHISKVKYVNLLTEFRISTMFPTILTPQKKVWTLQSLEIKIPCNVSCLILKTNTHVFCVHCFDPWKNPYFAINIIKPMKNSRRQDVHKRMCTTVSCNCCFLSLKTETVT